MVDCQINPGTGVPPISWEPACRVAPIGRNEVHVYGAVLDCSHASLARFAEILCDSERDRAARFHFEVHRDRFIAGRGLVRQILGAVLDRDPASLAFTFGPQGKPALAPEFNTSKLQFNLSHSEDMALVAITHGEPVGVDLEKIRELPDFDLLVERFFSIREHNLFGGLAPAAKVQAFFNLWTRKEALLKATGEGIGRLLHLVEVAFLPGEAAGFVSLPFIIGKKEAWQLSELHPAAGFVGALALKGRKQIRQWRWREDFGGGTS